MFLGQMDKPDVDYIEGLSPAISIDQKTTSKNPRSTVGTVTEIYDYLRLLYARVGVPHCPICGEVIKQQSVDEIVDRILELPTGTRFMVLSPVVWEKKGMHDKVLADPAPFIRMTEMTDRSLKIILRVWCNTQDFWGVKFDLTEGINRTFAEMNITVAVPKMDVRIKND